jgi:hypothetical protein
VTGLGRRLRRLERRHDPSSDWDVIDELLSELTTPELRLLMACVKRREDGRVPTADETAAETMLAQRLRAVGIIWP